MRLESTLKIAAQLALEGKRVLVVCYETDPGTHASDTLKKLVGGERVALITYTGGDSLVWASCRGTGFDVTLLI